MARIVLAAGILDWGLQIDNLDYFRGVYALYTGLKHDVLCPPVSALGSIAERADLLNRYQTYVGDPGYIERDLARYRGVTPESLQAVLKGTLDPEARVILRVVPKDSAPEKAPRKGGGK